jgi:hypothetical protein
MGSANRRRAGASGRGHDGVTQPRSRSCRTGRGRGGWLDGKCPCCDPRRRRQPLLREPRRSTSRSAWLDSGRGMQPGEARLEHPHHVGLSDGAAVVSGGDHRPCLDHLDEHDRPYTIDERRSRLPHPVQTLPAHGRTALDEHSPSWCRLARRHVADTSLVAVPRGARGPPDVTVRRALAQTQRGLLRGALRSRTFAFARVCARVSAASVPTAGACCTQYAAEARAGHSRSGSAR